MTEYVVCITRNRDFTFPFSVETTTVGKKYPLNNAGNSIGVLTFPAGAVQFSARDAVYEPSDMSEGNITTRLLDQVIVKEHRNIEAFRLEGEWRYSQIKLAELVAAGDAITISKAPFRPNHAKAGGEVKKMHNLLTPTTYGVGTNEDGSAEVNALIGGSYFDNPKPTSLIGTLARAVTYDDPGALVLDFFAGSGTTGHAIMALNASDGGGIGAGYRCNSRNLCLKTAKPAKGFDTIVELSHERIRRAGEKIEEDFSEQLPKRDTPLDVGFRAYQLSDTSFSKWQVSSDTPANELEQHLLELRESANDNATPADLFVELLLKQGYSLTEDIGDVSIAGLDLKTVLDADGDVAVLAYLDEHSKPTLDQLREIADSKPVRFVILEDCFQGDDELKTNLVQICKTNGIELWTA